MKKWVVFGGLFFLFACGEDPVETNDIKWSKKDSTNLNKELIEEEKIQIKLYLAHHKDWKVTETGTGLRYFIYANGSGPTPKVGQKAHVILKVELLEGTVCYTTEKEMEDIFVVDKSDIESGIQEAIKLMRVGDKAKLIIPAHLGHGITGDLDKIPPLSTLVVDIQLNKLD
jgi:FKBP-type peptidyl-prolyl cis-trans isomerase